MCILNSTNKNDRGAGETGASGDPPDTGRWNSSQRGGDRGGALMASSRFMAALTFLLMLALITATRDPLETHAPLA